LKILCLTFFLMLTSPQNNLSFNPELIYEIRHNPDSNFKTTDKEYKRLGKTEIQKISQLNSVNHVERNLMTILYSDSLQLPYNTLEVLDIPITRVQLYGLSTENLFFRKNVFYEILQGRNLDERDSFDKRIEKHPLLISKLWAMENDLSVGDKIDLHANYYFIPVPYIENNWKEIYSEENLINSQRISFEIVGVFDVSSEVNEIFFNMNRNMIAPEYLIEKIEYDYIQLEKEAFRKKYSNESWWPNYMENIPKTKEEISGVPFFVTNSKKEGAIFRRNANEILSPNYIVENIFK